MIKEYIKHWLSKRGYTVLGPHFVGMVISGPGFFAIQHNNGEYTVTPPFPRAYLVVRNHAYANLNAKARRLEGKDVLVKKDQYGATTYSCQEEKP